MVKRSIPTILATALALTFGLTGCGGDDGSGFKPVNAGKLTVCTEPPYAPFEEVVDGQIVGFDIDLMNEVAKDLGLELNPRETPFEAIESAAALNIGECDVGASALTITDDRAAKLDFSVPYFESTLGLLVRVDSNVTRLDDLDGKPVGVQQGTTGEIWAHEQARFGEIRQFEGLGQMISALRAGEVDGVLNDEPALVPYEQDGTMQVVDTFDTGERLGFAVKKDNTELLDQINKTLARLKSDGTFDELQARWFSTLE